LIDMLYDETRVNLRPGSLKLDRIISLETFAGNFGIPLDSNDDIVRDPLSCFVLFIISCRTLRFTFLMQLWHADNSHLPY
ncbi:hypothetical protein MKX03_035246, partial [Papaver bracteatum]